MDLDGAASRLDAAADRREPTKKGYHTGPRPSGRESAARQLCSIRKDMRQVRLVVLLPQAAAVREDEPIHYQLRLFGKPT